MSMWTPGIDASTPLEGLTAIQAEFYTEHFIVRGELTSPEARLSDHLNSSTTTLELNPSNVHRSDNKLVVHVEGSAAYITKAHLLFVLPISEPLPAPVDPAARVRTVGQTCWAGIGRYNVLGKLHMEAGRNPRLLLRSLEERQFLPFTEVQLTLPDGTIRSHDAVLVNRFHLELLAIQFET